MMSPTLACIDYLNIERDVREMDKAGVDFFHIDVMDGHYVPNLSLNFDLAADIRKISKTPMDVHLMVENPMDYVDRMAALGIEYACCHPDALDDPAVFLRALRAKGIKAGLALAPGDGVAVAEAYLDLLDYVLVLFVQPGFSGQQFQPENLKKVRVLDALRKEKKPGLLIEADGGIGWDNVSALVSAGVDISVAGVFAVFGQPQGLYNACAQFKRQARSLKELKEPKESAADAPRPKEA